MIGLTSHQATTPRRNAVDFAMYFVQFGDEMVFRIYESGVFKKTVGHVSTGDQMSIHRHSDGSVHYLLNETAVYVSHVAAGRELFFHSSHWSQAFTGETPHASGHTVVAS